MRRRPPLMSFSGRGRFRIGTLLGAGRWFDLVRCARLCWAFGRACGGVAWGLRGGRIFWAVRESRVCARRAVRLFRAEERPFEELCRRWRREWPSLRRARIVERRVINRLRAKRSVMRLRSSEEEAIDLSYLPTLEVKVVHSRSRARYRDKPIHFRGLWWLQVRLLTSYSVGIGADRRERFWHPLIFTLEAESRERLWAQCC